VSFLRNTWYVAMWAEALEPGALVPRTIIGEPLVLFRRQDGGVAVMHDICPHRFAPLHKGAVLPGDRVKCPYHGLQFDVSGACVNNPHGSGRIPANCKIRSFTAVEKHSLIWVWLGDDPADSNLIPDYHFLDPDSDYLVSRRDFLKMRANYRLVANNLLDLSHAPFLHAGILGYEDSIKADIDVRSEGQYVYVSRVKKDIRPAALSDLLFKADGANVDAYSVIRWSAPCNLLNDNVLCEPGSSRENGAGLLGAHILTPETETSTLYHFAAARQGAAIQVDHISPDEIKRQLSELRRMAFEEQDEPIIEAQQAFISNFPHLTAQPILLEIDAGPVRCNRILDDLLAKENSSRSTVPKP